MNDPWLPLPAGVTGQQVRHRKIIGPPTTAKPVRLGGAEIYVILAETPEHVIYVAYSQSGKRYEEKVMQAAEFEETFERKAADPVRYELRQESGVDTNGSNDPDRWAAVPVWTIFRYTRGGSGWSVGKYRNQKTAELVMTVLGAMKGHEY